MDWIFLLLLLGRQNSNCGCSCCRRNDCGCDKCVCEQKETKKCSDSCEDYKHMTPPAWQTLRYADTEDCNCK